MCGVRWSREVSGEDMPTWSSSPNFFAHLSLLLEKQRVIPKHQSQLRGQDGFFLLSCGLSWVNNIPRRVS